VLMGPGWGGAGDENEAPGGTIARLREAGFNVLTWDPRGFGASGGIVTVNDAAFEGRDVQVLLDFVAAQPQAQLDAPGDPRAGMAGASYGGGIQFVTAAIDKRVDAITPQIAWHSLGTSLYREQIVKTGWAGLLYAASAGRQVDRTSRRPTTRGWPPGGSRARTATSSSPAARATSSTR